MTVPGTVAARPSAWPLRSSLPALAPLPSVPSLARAHLAATVAGWRLGALEDDGRAVVSELAANAVAASADPGGNPRDLNGRMPLILVRLFSDGVTLLIEVHDQAPGVPLIREAGHGAESGRGLVLVSALAVQWGWNEVNGGKVVWAALSDE